MAPICFICDYSSAASLSKTLPDHSTTDADSLGVSPHNPMLLRSTNSAHSKGLEPCLQLFGEGLWLCALAVCDYVVDRKDGPPYKGPVKRFTNIRDCHLSLLKGL